MSGNVPSDDHKRGSNLRIGERFGGFEVAD